jgi:hypothetical protein
MRKHILKRLAEWASFQADFMMIVGALLFVVSAMCWGILNGPPAQWVQDAGVGGGASFGIGCVLQVILLAMKSKVESIL